MSDEELLKLPGVLSGTPPDIADTLRRYRDTYGLTYFTVQEHHAESFTKGDRGAALTPTAPGRLRAG